ncbi:MAG TPA: hypothetical protein GX717_02555, partial [Clostridiaceae bacterium]|nr:hypothetical protein [Clostridiaceae bacterium]
IQSLYPLQKNILDCSAAALRPGGRLIYSTCTLNPAENEGQLFTFLDDHPDFKTIDISSLLPPALLEKDSELLPSAVRGHITLRPDKHACEGFFIGVMERCVGC